jgi:thymidine kinase
MPKLYFRYGTMNSSKTANLLMVAHNYAAQGKSIVLIKPKIDTRFGSDTITSRAIEGRKADILLDGTEDKIHIPTECACVLVDEAQFLSERNVNALRHITQTTPVICYGLRTDYCSHLFTGSKRLMEIADTIEEIKTICVKCSKKAIVNAKFCIDGEERCIVRDGDAQIELGAEEKYQPMCWQCWVVT